jgi:hypothetical protein
MQAPRGYVPHSGTYALEVEASASGESKLTVRRHTERATVTRSTRD